MPHIEYTRLFYHFILSFSAITCFSIIMGLWVNAGKRWDYYGKGMLFSGLVILSWSMASIGHLLVEWLVEDTQSAQMTSSVFRLLSMFNNLFIFLLLPYLGLFRKWRSDRFNLQVTLIAIVLFMLIFLLDKIEWGGKAVGSTALVWIDVLIAIPIILFLGIGLIKTFRRLFPGLQVFLILNLFAVIIFFFLNIFSLAVPLFDLRQSEWVVSNVHYTYYIQYLALFYFMVAMVIVALKMQDESEWQHIFLDKQGSESYQMRDVKAVFGGDEQIEYLPEQLKIGVHKEIGTFYLIMDAQKGAEKRRFEWVGSNCTYPFFYWLYITLAAKHRVQVDIKDAQVNRNRMLRLLDKSLNPRIFVLLNGSQATLAFAAEKVAIDPEILENNAVKSKFREFIEPFLFLLDTDIKRFKTDMSYADQIMDELMEVFKKSL